jgi:hypothetical protein
MRTQEGFLDQVFGGAVIINQLANAPAQGGPFNGEYCFELG